MNRLKTVVGLTGVLILLLSSRAFAQYGAPGDHAFSLARALRELGFENSDVDLDS